MTNTVIEIKETALKTGTAMFRLDGKLYFLRDQKSIQWSPDEKEQWEYKWFIDADNDEHTGMMQLEEVDEERNGWTQYKKIEEAMVRIELMAQGKTVEMVSPH